MTLDWSVAVTEVPDAPLVASREATEAELSSLQKALGLLGIDDVSVDYTIKRQAGGMYRLSGQIRATVRQACIVSLEPVEEHINDDFKAEFWPGSVTPLAASGNDNELPVLDGTDVELIDNGRMDIGRVIFETLSGALNPYPRKDGAAFDWQDQANDNPDKVSPFAVLSKIRRDPD